MSHSHQLNTIGQRLLVGFAFILFITVHANSQTVLFNENFDNATLPQGWTVFDYPQNGDNWSFSIGSGNSGQYAAGCYSNAANNNAWLFTKPLALVAGKKYVLTYYAKVGLYGLLQVTLNTAPDRTAILKKLRGPIPEANVYGIYRDTFVCESARDYYICFNNYSVDPGSGGTLIDDVTLSTLDFPACASVTAGNITSPVTSVCSDVLFTLSNTGATTQAELIRYAWQKSSNGTNWTNITNSFDYSSSVTVSQTDATYYRLVDTCLSSGVTAISNQLFVDHTSFVNCYCRPASSLCNLAFTNVTILNTSINNNSSCVAGGYSDYSSLGASTVYRGQSISIKHDVYNNISVGYQIGIWIDFNHSGTFDENEFFLDRISSGITATSQLQIPATALIGETRMRLRVVYGSASNIMIYTAACDTRTGLSGETEDYKLNIVDPTPCTGSVTAGTITAGVTQICPNTLFTITSDNPTTNQSQMRFAWQKSPDNVNWTNINNISYLVNPLVTSQDVTSYYRLTDTCLATGQSSASNSILVTTGSIFNCYCTPNNSNCNTYSIDSVSFNTIHNKSACGTNGHISFVNTISTTINNGSDLPIYVSVTPVSSPKYVDVWIDLNRNGQYEDAERVFSKLANGTVASGNVHIPFNIREGETGMRVMVSFAFSSVSACYASSSGSEVEDYKVILHVANPADKHFVYYVNKSATGLNNGTSWANAFTSLDSPLSIITNLDTIKVARGIYNPAGTFSLRDSIIVLGGYPNTGNPSDADRDYPTNQTILSGEVGNAGLADNIPLLIQASNVKGFLIDGFIIENGYNGSSSGNGPIAFVNSTGTVRNTVIRNNTTASGGGASNVINSTINFINTIIHNNRSVAVTPAEAAGAISVRQLSVVNLVNSVVTRSTGQSLFNVSAATLNILNSTVFKNYSSNYVNNTGKLSFRNSISYFNGYNFTIDTTDFTTDYTSTISASNSITDAYEYGSGLMPGQPPLFSDTSTITGPDNKYFTADDGLTLVNPCSPAINTGKSDLISSFTTDITGAERIRNGVVDLGAYEVQQSISQQPKVLYVNKTATGQNNGLTWQDAYTNLQTALTHCSDSVKIAKGAYQLSTTDPYTYIQLSNNRVIMGGFPNTGSPTNADYNPNVNPTIIDGTVSASAKLETIILSKHNDSTARVLGLELINASTILYILNQNISVIKAINKSFAYFERIKLDASKNSVKSLVNIYGRSAPRFFKSVFYRGATNENYPGDVTASGGSSPQFLKCYFGKDTSATATTSLTGAMVVTNGASPLLDSCVFNKAVGNAASFHNNSSPVIKNCLFNKSGGRDILSEGSSPMVTGSIFNDTTTRTNENGGSLWIHSGSNAVFDRCIFLNSYSNQGGGVGDIFYSTATFKNSSFSGFYSSADGAGFLNQGSQLNLTNCVAYNYFSDEEATNIGSSFLFNSDNAVSTITNSTIIAPSKDFGPMLKISPNSSLHIYNSILWRYGAAYPGETHADDIITGDNNNIAFCDIRNSMLFKQRNTTMSNSTVGIGPNLVDLTDAPGPDNLIFTADDGLKPCTCSRAINGGNNNLIAEPLDITTGNRVLNGTIDIGAYEVAAFANSQNSFYVKQNAVPGGNGLSWSTAYNDLQKAIQNSCADTIHVAKGVYKPAVANRDSSFNIFQNIVILGGYPDTGNPTNADRNLNENPTILSGDIGIQNDSLDNSKSVVRINCPDSTVILDQLIIERGNGNIAPSYGGGIQSNGNKDVHINNCIIRNNYSINGGGLYTAWSGVDVYKSVIVNNNGSGYYVNGNHGGITSASYAPIVKIRNSVVSRNSGIGGIYNGSGAPLNVDNLIIQNTVFHGNEGLTGGALFMNGNLGVKITNCDFIRNKIIQSIPGAAIRVENSYIESNLKTVVHNSVFYGNLIGNSNPYSPNHDFEWHNGSASPRPIDFSNINYSAINQGVGDFGYHNIDTIRTVFQNFDDPTGPDNLWMTADDGIRRTVCSATIDRGYNPYSPNIVTDIIDSARIKNGTVDMGAYEAAVFDVRISTIDTAICPGTNVTFTAVTHNAGTNPVYQWQLNGANVGSNSTTFSSNTLNNNDVVTLLVTNNDCSTNVTQVVSNSIRMTVSSAITPVASIIATDTTICPGTSITFTATATHNNSNSVYAWYVNGINTGATASTYTASNFSNNDEVKTIVTINGSCLSTQTVQSNLLHIHITPAVAPVVSIVSSANPSCGTSGVTFSATPINGGSIPSYQWKVNGANAGTNSPTLRSTTLANNDNISVVMSSSAACATPSTATSNTIIQQVNAIVQPAVNVTSTAITCPGIPVTFTASAVNGGSAPSYNWLVNGTDTHVSGNTFTNGFLHEGDMVVAVMAGNAGCVGSATATSAPIIIHYPATSTTAVSIAVSGNNVCTNTSVTFTATPVNPGTNPVYEWRVNNISNGVTTPTFTTTALTNNDEVKVLLTSSAGCLSSSIATSNAIVMHLSSTATPSVSISANQTSLCPGATASFTAIPVNGGTSPTYQWKKNGTNAATGITYAYVPSTNGDILNCQMTSSLGCVATATVISSNFVVNLTPVPAIPVITITGSQLTTTAGFNSYQWYLNGMAIPGATTNVYAPVISGIYTVEIGNAAGCRSVSVGLNFVVTAVSNIVINGVNFTCFPNPVKDVLYVKSSSRLADKPMARLIDNTGRVVYQKVLTNQLESINVSALASGFYVLNITGKKGDGNFKIEVLH